VKKKKKPNKLEKEDLAAFGERLKEARAQLRLKQKILAEGLDVTGSSVSGFEKGKSKPSFEVLKKMFNNFNININYLLDGYGEAIVNRELTAALELDDTNPEDERLKELLYYIDKAPMVKYAVFEFISNYLYQNKDAIKEDMKKHSQYLQRLKNKQGLKRKK
jgi:transcriptional regulator with XRE-family HTH domain